MLLKSLTLTPKIYDNIKAEAIIDPNPQVFKACYLHLILNNDNEFEVLEKPERACTKEENEAATEYGKHLITSGMAIIENIDNDIERQTLKMDSLEYTDYKNYQEALIQFAKYVKMHATQDGSYKQALSDYVSGYFRAGKCKGRTQKAMREDVLNMVKTMYGSHPDIYVEVFKEAS
jgi:hypothetical protein